MKKLLWLSLFCFVEIGLAQYTFEYDSNIPVKKNNRLLENAWAGGLNFIQAGNIDLNLDGIKDLVLFDRSGNKICPFISKNIADSVAFDYAPQYRNKFPEIEYWMLLRDFNNDGKEDIFTYINGGLRVFKNISNTQDGLMFILESPQIISNYFGDVLPLYITSVDIPAIDDIDNDGDLDILTFSVNSVYVEFHKNLSVENNGNVNSLNSFSLQTGCWGKFRENELNCEITLNNPCTQLFSEPLNRDILHAGSSLVTFDADNDGDKDIIVSDISCQTVSVITNGGNATDAIGTEKTHDFPSQENAINLNVFPTPFFVDVNNDGKKDMLVSPNVGAAAENTQSVWYYKNIGTNTLPVFNKVQNDFFQDQMIENGEGCYPVLIDLNSDGKLDLLVSNLGNYETDGTFKSRIQYFKNTGTFNEPEFTLITEDYQNFSLLNTQSLYPAFGDLDNDNDPDLILGRSDGRLIYFRNEPINGEANFVLVQSFYSGIDVGNNSTPQLVDLNMDGKLDLVIGEERGNLNFCLNEGTVDNAVFNVSNMDVNFGNVNISEYNPAGINFGYSVPKFFKDDGVWKLICGSKSGFLHYYENISHLQGSQFLRVDSTAFDIWEGSYSSPEIADINNDQKFEIIVGNFSGGVTLFTETNDSRISENAENNVQIFPNPAGQFIQITVTNSLLNNTTTYEIYDLSGKKIEENTLQNNISMLNVNHYDNGIYLVLIKNEMNYVVKKLVIQK